MACSKRATLWKLPRRMAWLVIRANQRSTRFSHEALRDIKPGEELTVDSSAYSDHARAEAFRAKRFARKAPKN